MVVLCIDNGVGGGMGAWVLVLRGCISDHTARYVWADVV